MYLKILHLQNVFASIILIYRHRNTQVPVFVPAKLNTPRALGTNQKYLYGIMSK